MTTLDELKKIFLPAVAPEDFFILLAWATRKEKVFLLTHPEYPLSESEETQATAYLKRRLKHEPVASITGHKEFYGRDFLVTKDTLIPRPETELLIECALRRIVLVREKEEKENIDIIDIGTGSGNIIITLALEIKKMFSQEHFHYSALDISSQALAQAKENAKQHTVQKLIIFLESDLLKNFPLPEEKNHHALITANLPYLSTTIYNASDPDVRDYEPKSALESGADGLDHYRRLLSELPELLKHYHSLTIFFEISPEQSTLLYKIIREGFPQSSLSLFQDLSGRDRLIQADIRP